MEKAAHNVKATALAESYEKRAAHAAFMAGQATSLLGRKAWERRRNLYKRKALEARKALIR